jgi:hypothetical protein
MREYGRVRPATAPSQRPDGDTVSLGALAQLQQSAGNMAVGALVEPAPLPPRVVESTANDRLPLQGSVGRDGDNQPDDVEAVRARLAELGFDPGTTPDDLVAAITTFQQRVIQTSSQIDGIVTPGGMTHNALAVGARSGIERDGAALDTLVRDHAHPAVVALRTAVEDVETKAPEVPTWLRQERGEARDELVEMIGRARDQVTALEQTDLPADEQDAIGAWAHRRLNAASPYYAQMPNVDLLELDPDQAKRKRAIQEGRDPDAPDDRPPPIDTRTCNLTTVAIVLEALGIGAEQYQGDRDVLERVRTGRSEKSLDHAKDFSRAEDDGGGSLDDLRLPDFLQLVMVAFRLERGASMDAAVAGAWDDVLSSANLVELARRFGVSAYVRAGLGSDDPDVKRRYLEAIGGMLDGGLQLVCSNGEHFVRIEAVTDDGLIVDDPAGFGKKNMKVPWAKLGGYVKTLMVFG